MGQPGAAETFLCFENDKARARTLLGEMIRTADPGNAGADDRDVEVLGLLRFGFGEYCRLGHSDPSRFVSELDENIQSSSEVNWINTARS